MKYILIFWIYTGGGGGLGASTAEFDTYKACMIAGASVAEQSRARYVCVKKGD